MAHAGIGLDILEIERMERALVRTPHFAERLFTQEEQAFCMGHVRPAQHFAGCFVAREAVLKALGTGFSGGIGLKDVSLIHTEEGRPEVLLHGKALECAQEAHVLEFAISLSYTHDLAACTAVAVTHEVQPHKEENDTQNEMFRSFKEARGILDELDTLLEKQAAFAVEGENADATRP